MPKPDFRLLAVAATAMLLLAGCAAGPDFQRPAQHEGDAYLEPAAADALLKIQTAPDAQALVAGMDIPGRWWELFQSRALNDLIARAIKANPDLKAAEAALRSSRETVLAAKGAYLPSVDLSLQPTRQKTADGAVSSSAADGASLYNLHTAQVSVAYAPDVFGGVRRGVESQQAQADLQRFQLEAAYLTLSANVVNAVIQEASLRDQIAATREAIEIDRKLLEIVQQGRRLGQNAEADVALQETALAQAEAGLPALEKQLAQQRDQLAVLLGRTPGEGLTEQFDLASLQLPQKLPLSLPSRLLEQRPDIRAAEESLHAASAEIGVAVANRLPNISISASVGSSAYEIGQLFKPGTGFWMLAGSLVQPLFHGGTLQHQQKAAEAAYDQSAAQYRSTVLAAFRDVADTLHAIDADGRTYTAAQAAERASARSLAIATRQKQVGDLSTLGLLAARQAWLQTRLALVQAQANRLADSAALFQALGGGWWNRTDTTPTSML